MERGLLSEGDRSTYGLVTGTQSCLPSMLPWIKTEDGDCPPHKRFCTRSAGGEESDEKCSTLNTAFSPNLCDPNSMSQSNDRLVFGGFGLKTRQHFCSYRSVCAHNMGIRTCSSHLHCSSLLCSGQFNTSCGHIGQLGVFDRTSCGHIGQLGVFEQGCLRTGGFHSNMGRFSSVDSTTNMYKFLSGKHTSRKHCLICQQASLSCFPVFINQFQNSLQWSYCSICNLNSSLCENSTDLPWHFAVSEKMVCSSNTPESNNNEYMFMHRKNLDSWLNLSLPTGRVKESKTDILHNRLHVEDRKATVTNTYQSKHGQYNFVHVQPTNHPTSNTPKTVNTDFLPDEILLHIFSFLTPPGLCCHVATVCKRWHHLAYDPSLWTRLEVPRSGISATQLREIVQRVSGSVRYLNVTGVRNLCNADMTAMVKHCPHLLHLHANFMDEVDATLTSTVLLSCCKLQFLNVAGCYNMNQEMMEQIVTKAGPALKGFNFKSCPFGDDSLLLLMKHVVGVTHLNIDGMPWISERVVQSVVNSYCSSLEGLELDGQNITDQTIACVSGCSRLRTLSISHCHRLTKNTIRLLVSLEHLEKLVLQKGFLFPTGALMEFFSTHLVQGLRHLDLTECAQLDNEGVQAIAQSCGGSLRTLCLSWCCHVSDRGLNDIASCCFAMEEMQLVGVRRLKATWLSTSLTTMPYLRNVNFEQCTKVCRPVLEEAVRSKPNLTLHDYYGHVVVP